MSKIADRLGSRYDDILAYFRRVPFGSYPPDMRALSGLPPVDRCLILEQLLLQADGEVLALIDKLSMAYLKAGWGDLAFSFLRAAYQRGLMPRNAYVYFEDKISSLMGVRLSSSSYAQSISIIKDDAGMAPKLCALLLELCYSYLEADVFHGVDFENPIDAQDVRAFLIERTDFISLIATGG